MSESTAAKKSDAIGSKRVQQRGNVTHEKLYQAALAEFCRVGFAEAQIETITKKAGTSRASFYFHFPSKDDVLLEAQRRRVQGIVAMLDQETTRSDQALLSVRAFLESTFDAILKQAEMEEDPRLIQELLALQIRRPAKEGGDNPVVKRVYAFFKRAVVSGQVRDDISPTELTKAFMNCVFELLREVAENSTNYRESCKSIIKIFVRGVSP